MKLFSIDVILPSQRGLHNKLIDLLVEVETTPKTIGEVSGIVMGLLKDLKDNQAKHDEINKRMHKQCVDEENFRKKEIADAKSAYNAASSAFAKCQASLNAAKANLPTLKKAKADFEDNLKKKTEERKKQHELYLQRRKDWQEAIAFLQEFIKQVDTKLAKYPSFADLGEKLLRHVAKLGRMAEAVEVFIALAENPEKEELATGPGAHSNYSMRSQAKTVGNLKTHLRTLLNKLIVDSKQNDIDEGKAQAAFEKVKAELTKIIDNLRKDINSTETQIKNMNACVANEGAIMTTANNKLSRNTKLKDLGAKTCVDFAKEYIAATENRLKEMTVIEQIFAIMKRRFGELPNDVVTYLDATKSGFKIYVNSTQFIRYKEYVQKHVADNLAGKKLVAQDK